VIHAAKGLQTVSSCFELTALSRFFIEEKAYPAHSGFYFIVSFNDFMRYVPF
jgi:hypothetical protein